MTTLMTSHMNTPLGNPGAVMAPAAPWESQHDRTSYNRLLLLCSQQARTMALPDQQGRRVESPEVTFGEQLNRSKRSLSPDGGIPSMLVRRDTPMSSKKAQKQCQVCSQVASGNFFGASVCLPCKTFFIRCSGEDIRTFRCRSGGDCDVTGLLRSRCKSCRYAKCIDVGMSRKERPEQVEATEGQQLCVVCGDLANGVHFGVVSCEGCKKFFRRGLQEYTSYMCKSGQMCVINPRTRNECRYCRYQKCMSVGMSRKAIKMGRPRKDTQWIISNGQHHQVSSPMSHRYHPYDIAHGTNDYLHGRVDNMSMMVPHGVEREDRLGYNQGHHLPHVPSSLRNSQDGGQRRFSESHDTDWNSGSSSGYTSDVEAESPVDYSGKLSLSHRVAPYNRNTEHVTYQTQEKYRFTNNIGKEYKATDAPCDLKTHITVKTEPANSDLNHPTKVSPPPPPPPPHQQPNDNDELTTNKVDRILQYRFPAKYWLKLDLPDVVLSPDTHETLCCKVTTANKNLTRGFLNQNETGEDDVTRDVLTRRIVNHTCLVMGFVQDIPGFGEVAAVDKYTIFRLTGVQLSILVAAQNLYDEDSNTFSGNFYEQDLPSTDPLFHFRNSILDYASQIQSLNLSDRENGLLLALVAIATDWPDLQYPEVLDGIFQSVLKSFMQCVREKTEASEERARRILSYIPRLRQLGQWHYELTLKDVLAHF